MAKFSNPTDELGLAVAGKIILENPSGGLRQDAVEQLDQTGNLIGAVTKMIRPRTERSASYKIVAADAALTLHFGALVNSLWVLTGATISMRNSAHVDLAVQYMKLSNVNKFNTALMKAFNVDIPAGFGVATLLGCTVASPGDAIEGSIGVQTQAASEIEKDSGDFQQAGYWIYGAKLTKQLTATGVITLPTAALNVSTDHKEPPNGAETFAASWLEYPTFA